MKILLAVPFENKDEAKKLGAKWDAINKKWYIYENNPNKDLFMEKWKINDDPVNLIGEDRNFGGNKLFVDLIPQTCWFSNVRSSIHPNDWDRVRNHIYNRVDYICECCGHDTKETGISLEAHERWQYDSDTLTQKLILF